MLPGRARSAERVAVRPEPMSTEACRGKPTRLPAAPPGRLCWLHSRARGIPLAAAGLVLIAVAAAAAAYALAHPDLPPSGAGDMPPAPDGGSFQPDRRVPVVAAAPLLAVLLAGGGLSGADPDLERATPVRWWRWRAAHLAGIAVVVGAVLAIGVTHGSATFGAAAMARNVIGYVGCTALAATALGASLAWAPPFLYAATVYLAAPRNPTGAALWWAWPMSPGSWDGSWICAIVLFLVGTAVYVWRGCGAVTRALTADLA